MLWQDFAWIEVLCSWPSKTINAFVCKKKAWFLWSRIALLLSCIDTSCLVSPPWSSLKCLSQVHFGSLSASASVLVSVELAMTNPNFFGILIIDPWPRVTSNPEHPLLLECSAWALSARARLRLYLQTLKNARIWSSALNSSHASKNSNHRHLVTLRKHDETQMTTLNLR